MLVSPLSRGRGILFCPYSSTVESSWSSGRCGERYPSWPSDVWVGDLWFVRRFLVGWFGNLLLAGICFSVVNAAIEELIFRGILWELVSYMVEPQHRWLASLRCCLA